MESSQSLFKNKLVLGVGAGFLLFLILIVVLVSMTVKKKTAQTNTLQPNGVPSQSPEQINANIVPPPVVRRLPQVSFSTYSTSVALPALPQKINTYFFGSSFTSNDAHSLQAKLGVQLDLNKDGTTTLTYKDKANTSAMIYSKVNGTFYFYTKKGPVIVAPDYLAAAQQYLTEKGLWDTTMKTYTYYKDSTSPGSVFVEIHRDPVAAGFPIFNAVGILNVPEQTRLSSIQVGKADASFPDDSTITFVQGDVARKQRPDDFNSIVVQLSEKEKQLISVSSNMRLLDHVDSQTNPTNINSPKDALDMVQAGKSVFTLTIPAGQGTAEPAKVYPNGIANAQNAVITDMMVVYLEQTPTTYQPKLTPMYVFKGTASLDSGYKVRFLEVIPVYKNEDTKVLGAQTERMNNLLAQANTPTPGANSIQLGTFNGLSPVVNQPGTDICTDLKNGNYSNITNVYKTEIGYIMWNNQTAAKGNTYVRDWYLISTSRNAVDPSQYQTHAGRGTGPLADVGAACPRNQPQLCTDFSEFNAEVLTPAPGVQYFCTFLTSASPRVYLYSPSDTGFSVAVKPFSGVTYADPAFSYASQWNGQIQNGHMSLSTGIQTNSLYYEYSRPKMNAVIKKLSVKEGFIFERTELLAKLSPLLHQMRLTDSEVSDMLTEVTREMKPLTSQYVQVSFLPEAFLNKYLPISISPQPTKIERLHLFIQPAKSTTNLNMPYSLPKLDRSGYYAIETGVFVEY